MSKHHKKNSTNNELDELIAMSNDDEIKSKSKKKSKNNDDTDDDSDTETFTEDEHPTDNDEDDDYEAIKRQAKRARQRKSSEYLTHEDGNKIEKGKTIMSQHLESAAAPPQIIIPIPDNGGAQRMKLDNPNVLNGGKKRKKLKWYQQKWATVVIILILVLCTSVVLWFIGCKLYRLYEWIKNKHHNNYPTQQGGKIDTRQLLMDDVKTTTPSIMEPEEPINVDKEFKGFGNSSMKGGNMVSAPKNNAKKRLPARDAKGRFVKRK